MDMTEDGPFGWWNTREGVWTLKRPGGPTIAVVAGHPGYRVCYVRSRIVGRRVHLMDAMEHCHAVVKDPLKSQP